MNIDYLLLKEILDNVSIDYHLEITMEELAELIQAIVKTKRTTNVIDFHLDEKAVRENLIEEIADVTLCLAILKRLLHIGNSQVNDYVDTKLLRYANRLNNAKIEKTD